MRALGFVLGLFYVAAGGCAADHVTPVDASAEHVLPSDLGQPCGPAAGCFQVLDQPGHGCLDRCVTLGVHDAVCSTRCNGPQDCGAAAPVCNFGENATIGVCTPYSDLQNDIGCTADAAADSTAADAL